jgi:hypothetical protein
LKKKYRKPSMIEENLQHDENEEPITFVNKKQVKSIEHEDHVQHDENEDPRTFAENA